MPVVHWVIGISSRTDIRSCGETSGTEGEKSHNCEQKGKKRKAHVVQILQVSHHNIAGDWGQIDTSIAMTRGRSLLMHPHKTDWENTFFQIVFLLVGETTMEQGGKNNLSYLKAFILISSVTLHS